jgi:AAA+ ATPase superfamily predicted ATPase
MNLSIIGREEEQQILRKTLVSKQPEMVAVLGRYRVGKTFLIQSVFKDNIAFEITGTQNAPKDEQLLNFTYEISKISQNPFPIQPPKSWMEAFILLIKLLEQRQTAEKQVIFFDEVPWLATPKSGFLRALGFFWNSWAVKQNIVVVICGSATSWMIQKVVNHTGGLHNRITKSIHLAPFTLLETELYLKNREIYLDRYQIVQLYMAIGGIPHYLNAVDGNGKSAAQHIDNICFSKNGLLKNEFFRLYPSLFSNADNHIAIIKTLAKSRLGLTRKKIIDNAKLPNGGGLTKALEELEHSGFISTYYPFSKKKKEKLFRLTDEYSLFYLQFMEDKIHEDENIWMRLSQTQQYKTWSGYAFESICLKHIPQVKKALGISGVYALSSTFYKRATKTEKGTQIDLLLDINDHIINLFEIKFYNETFSLTKKYANELREKQRIFKVTTQTKKQINWSMITTFGLKHNEHSLGLVQNVLTLDDLFE